MSYIHIKSIENIFIVIKIKNEIFLFYTKKIKNIHLA